MSEPPFRYAVQAGGLYDTGSNDEDWAKAVLADFQRMYPNRTCELKKMPLPWRDGYYSDTR